MAFMRKHNNQEDQQAAGDFYASALRGSGVSENEISHSKAWIDDTTLEPSSRDWQAAPSRQRALTGESASSSSPSCNRKASCKGMKSWESMSIGYKLLKKAGYKGKGGLGLHEQGTAVPIEAWNQSGKEGIGHVHAGKAEAHKSAGEHEANPIRKTALQSNGQALTEAARQEARQKSMRKKLRRSWPTVKVEEPLDQKVIRWNQILQAEADEQAGKELERYIFRQFNDNSVWDTNPLTRYNNLSSTNPLL